MQRQLPDLVVPDCAVAHAHPRPQLGNVHQGHVALCERVVVQDAGETSLHVQGGRELQPVEGGPWLQVRGTINHREGPLRWRCPVLVNGAPNLGAVASKLAGVVVVESAARDVGRGDGVGGLQRSAHQARVKGSRQPGEVGRVGDVLAGTVDCVGPSHADADCVGAFEHKLGQVDAGEHLYRNLLGHALVCRCAKELVVGELVVRQEAVAVVGSRGFERGDLDQKACNDLVCDAGLGYRSVSVLGQPVVPVQGDLERVARVAQLVWVPAEAHDAVPGAPVVEPADRAVCRPRNDELRQEIEAGLPSGGLQTAHAHQRVAVLDVVPAGDRVVQRVSGSQNVHKDVREVGDVGDRGATLGGGRVAFGDDEAADLFDVGERLQTVVGGDERAHLGNAAHGFVDLLVAVFRAQEDLADAPLQGPLESLVLVLDLGRVAGVVCVQRQRVLRPHAGLRHEFRTA